MILSVKDVSKTYSTRRRKVEAVKNINLSASSGEIIGFLGPNGAGKTTTLKIVSGLISPDSGSVRVAGENPLNNKKVMQAIGSVMEGNRSLYWKLTCKENLVYFATLKGMQRKSINARADLLLEKFGLTEKSSSLVQELSRGMQQKLAIAIAIMHEPQLLLLDEPTLGLDVEASANVKALVRELSLEGHAIILTTHLLNDVEELADKVVIINKGKIIQSGSVQDITRLTDSFVYEIQFASPPDSYVLGLLSSYKPEITGTQILVTVSDDEVETVLKRIAHLPIERFVRKRMNLAQAFLEITSEKGAEIASLNQH
jgi:ABC-2 type transport system ATP-binding protein